MYESTNIAERIKLTAKSKNIKIKVMLDECRLNKNALHSMLSGGSTPKSENLAKIADYLNCSVDYLLGRTDDPTINKENSTGGGYYEIIDKLTYLNNNEIDYIKLMIEAMISKKNNNEKKQ